MIDEIPIFSILATFAKGNSSFTGGNELKNKESDRIKSLYEGLCKCKIKVKKKEGGLQIFGKQKKKQKRQKVLFCSFSMSSWATRGIHHFSLTSNVFDNIWAYGTYINFIFVVYGKISIV